MSKIYVAACLIGLVLASPALAQMFGGSMNPDSAPLRFGIGMTFTTSLYFPGDLNNLVDDFAEASGAELDGLEVDDTPSLLFGVGGRAQAQLTLGSMLQVEPWIEYLYGGERSVDLYYFETDYDSYSLEEGLTLDFKPSYVAPGVTLYVTPGMASGLYPKLGVGLGIYMGKVKVDQSYEYAYYDYGTDMTTYDYQSVSEEYSGTAVGLHGVAGIAFAVTDNIRIEATLVGRYAKIAELENEDGVKLTNPYRGDEKVSLDFSGIDFRLGGSVVF